MPPKAVQPPDSSPLAGDDSDDGFGYGTLAEMWESTKVIRNRLLTEGHFTQWVNKDAVGIKSVKAMVLNHLSLEVLAEFWCPQHEMVKAVPIGIVRREAGQIKILNY